MAELSLDQQKAIALASARLRASQASAPQGPQPTLGDKMAASPVGRFAHDAIAGIPMGIGHLLSKIDPTAPDDAKTQAMMEDPYQASLAANRNTPGYAAARQNADQVIASGGHSLSDQFLAPMLPAMAGAAGLTGGLDQSNAMADAQAASQSSYQQQHPWLSTGAQLAGGLMAIPEGGASLPPAIPKQPVPTVADLRKGATAAYKAVDNSGLAVAGDAYDQMVSDLKTKLDKLGIDPDLHPDATAAFNRLDALRPKPGASASPVSFQNVNTLRELAGDAAGATLPRDAMRGGVIQDHIDDFVDNLTPAQTVGGADPAQTVASLNEARGLYSRAKQAETIQSVIDKADIKAAGYSQSGAENSLRAGFRQLALNDRKMARLSPDLQKTVKDVAKGGPINLALRGLGKFAPHGVVSTGLGVGTGMLAGGPAGAIALPLAGEAARYGATAMTKAAADRALNTALIGSSAPSVAQMPLRAPAMTSASRTPYGLFANSPWLLAHPKQAQ